MRAKRKEKESRLRSSAPPEDRVRFAAISEHDDHKSHCINSPVRSSERGRRQSADAVQQREGRGSATRGRRKYQSVLQAANLHPDEARAQTVVVRELAGAVHGAAGASGLRQTVLR